MPTTSSAEEAIANRMNSEFQRRQQGKKNHKRIRRTFTKVMHHLCLLIFQHMTWHLTKTYDVLCLQGLSDYFSERKCMFEFVAEVKGNCGWGRALR